MNRFGHTLDETDQEIRQNFVRRSTCPVCLLSPCSETCPIGFDTEELLSFRDRLLGRESENYEQQD